MFYFLSDSSLNLKNISWKNRKPSFVKVFIKLVPNRFILTMVREKNMAIFNPMKEVQFSSDNTQRFRKKYDFFFKFLS